MSSRTRKSASKKTVPAVVVVRFVYSKPLVLRGIGSVGPGAELSFDEERAREILEMKRAGVNLFETVKATGKETDNGSET